MHEQQEQQTAAVADALGACGWRFAKHWHRFGALDDDDDEADDETDDADEDDEVRLVAFEEAVDEQSEAAGELSPLLPPPPPPLRWAREPRSQLGRRTTCIANLLSSFV